MRSDMAAFERLIDRTHQWAMNSDSAVASAASRMVVAADGRPIIEMGSRRTQEYAAVTAARAAYLAGFQATSNLEAGYRYDIPVSGTAAHAWTLAHVNEDGTPNEEAAFRTQIETLGVETTLLVDTYDITKGVETAVKVAGPELGGVRIDSGDLGPVTRRVRKQLDELGNHNTKIVVSSDLDEFAIAGLRGDPVDVYGVGTSVVTGSGAPTAGMVYKVVEVEGHPVAKRSSSKKSQGGAKRAIRTYRSTGVAVEELVLPFGAPDPETGTLSARENSAQSVTLETPIDDPPRAVEVAFESDNKVLVEPEIVGAEVEIGVLEYADGSVIAMPTPPTAIKMRPESSQATAMPKESTRA